MSKIARPSGDARLPPALAAHSRAQAGERERAMPTRAPSYSKAADGARARPTRELSSPPLFAARRRGQSCGRTRTRGWSCSPVIVACSAVCLVVPRSRENGERALPRRAQSFLRPAAFPRFPAPRAPTELSPEARALPSIFLESSEQTRSLARAGKSLFSLAERASPINGIDVALSRLRVFISPLVRYVVSVEFVATYLRLAPSLLLSIRQLFNYILKDSFCHFHADVLIYTYNSLFIGATCAFPRSIKTTKKHTFAFRKP